MAAVRQLSYRVVEGWEKTPPGLTRQDAVGVGVDSRDRVYLFTRERSLVLVYERDGSFVAAWGEGLFTARTHGLTVGPDDAVYCVDDGNHTVRKFTPDGQVLLTLGTPGQPSDTGYSGHGVMGSAGGSRLAVDAMLGRVAPAENPFRVDRPMEPRPFDVL